MIIISRDFFLLGSSFLADYVFCLFSFPEGKTRKHPKKVEANIVMTRDVVRGVPNLVALLIGEHIKREEGKKRKTEKHLTLLGGYLSSQTRLQAQAAERLHPTSMISLLHTVPQGIMVLLFIKLCLA